MAKIRLTAFALAALLGAAAVVSRADARTCYTNCYTSTSCQTTCF